MSKDIKGLDIGDMNACGAESGIKIMVKDSPITNIDFYISGEARSSSASGGIY